MSSRTHEVIPLGIRLNQLLNRHTQLGESSSEGVRHGLVLPRISTNNQSDNMDEESGIVVISGDPGSGKSTLGLQIAVASAHEGYDSAYLSLEEEAERIKRKAAIFNWDSMLCVPDAPSCLGAGQLTTLSGQVVPDGKGLGELLTYSRAKVKERNSGPGVILLPSLLPRPLAKDDSRLTDYFWNQYRHIEFLVRSAAAYNRSEANVRNNHEGTPQGIRLVVIDSLNMIGIERANREMMYRLFDLFRQNRIMGVLTSETKAEASFDSTMGDVIFKFSKTNDSGYEVTLLECAKSRFTARSLGLHPYKIIAPSRQQGAKTEFVPGEEGVVAYPSLHAVIHATEQGPQTFSHSDPELFPFGWGDAMTKRLLRIGLHRGGVVALVGPNGTFKTQIALNYLVHGLVVKKKQDGVKEQPDGESVLYLRLHSPEDLHLKDLMPYGDPLPGWRLDKVGRVSDKKNRAQVRKLKIEGKIVKLEYDVISKRIEQIGERTKAGIKSYANLANRRARMIVADFRTGMLLPEEFIDIIRRIFDVNKHDISSNKIKRVVLDDVASIGTSYPLLRHSTTTGDMFLSSLVHVLKNYGTDLLLLGTFGDLTEANVMVNQACSLADGVLRTSIETVFGDKYVLLTGDGGPGKEQHQGESTPVVLRQAKESDEDVELIADGVLLKDFVGFETGQIERPGIVLQFYQENETERKYNLAVLHRLQERYGKPDRHQSSGVRLIQFGTERLVEPRSFSAKSSSVPPNESTVVRMIDEFEVPSGKPLKLQRLDQKGNRYIRNVLLMAFRQDCVELGGLKRCKTWAQIAGAIQTSILSKDISRHFSIDQTAPETLASLVLECLLTGDGVTKGIKLTNSSKVSSVRFPKEFNSTAQKFIVGELSALRRLIFEPNDAPVHTLDDFRTQPLPVDAAVYVCWYSQLRELLNRKPELAFKLDVCSLPGNGFRGDWYLNVDQGSVSVSLGESIANQLRSEGEDFARYQSGISLPVNDKAWRGSLPAWPGARSNVTMKSIRSIWENANSRSALKNYALFNRLLSGIGETIARLPLDAAGHTENEYLLSLTRRLPKVVASVCSTDL